MAFANPLPRRSDAALAWTVLALVASCGTGADRSTQVASHSPGTVVELPGGSFFISDPNLAGNGPELRLTRVAHGRLVEVFGLDASGVRVPMASEFMIGPFLESDGQNYSLETNAVTSQQSLIILRDVTDTVAGGGRTQFYSLLKLAEGDVIPIQSLAAGGAGTYSMLPRNGALLLQFDDLLDEASVDASTLRVLTGIPPSLPFEARIFLDPHHGGLASGNFRSSRVYVDMTVSELESFSTSPPLPVNSLGLPPAVDVNLANMEVRIPTLANSSVGQTSLLTNVSGHPLATVGNGPVDFNSPTLDVVRAARSGGKEEQTGDAYNGFLPDRQAPRIVGTQGVQIPLAPVHQGGAFFLVPQIHFDAKPCAQTPDPGDLLVQPGVYAEVTRTPTLVQDGVLKNVEVRLIVYPWSWDAGAGPAEWITTSVGAAEFRAPFDLLADAGSEACYIRILPQPSGYPAQPGVGLHTSSSLELRFSEAMDPMSVTAFDSLTLTRSPAPPTGGTPLATDQYVVGSVAQSADLTRFTYVPDLPLAHAVGVAETYFLNLASDTWSPTDLSGNPLDFSLPQVALSLDPTLGPQSNGGRVSRFSALDEEAPFGDEGKALPEWSGQHLFDLDQELIRPRPVVRSLGVVDRTNPVPAMMAFFTLGVQTPLSSYGSRCQAIWRYCDFGLGLTDPSKFNMDLEGLYWSPAAGSVVFDTFTRFEIRLAHSAWVPDEYVNSATNLPLFGASGLTNFYSKNILDAQEDPLAVVHPRYLGYQVNPGDMTATVLGTDLMPYPWNRGVSPEDWSTYTWRDTSLRKRGAKGGAGLDLFQNYYATGKPRPSNPYFMANQARSSGLSLLMDFSCFPDEGAVGQNALAIALASASAPQPYFRAFTTGGMKKNGKIKLVNPDNETRANGGFNPLSSPPGATTPGNDPVLYMGAADFVVRTSRSHSLWFPATDPLGGGTFGAPTYSTPITEPRLEDQTAGTSVVLNFRGITSFVPPADACTGLPVMGPLEDAMTLDLYGDHYNDACIPNPNGQPNHSTKNENLGLTFLNADDEWKATIQEVDGAPYYQIRLTFMSDIFSGLSPELSAVAVSWQE
jgi:hypothetical protein